MAEPTHVMRAEPEPGKKLRTTWCGIKENDDARFPYVGEHAVAMHVRQRGMKLCLACEEAIEAEGHWPYEP